MHVGPAVIETYSRKKKERAEKDGPGSKNDSLVYVRKGKKSWA